MTVAGFLAYALALGIAAAIPGPGVVALAARALPSVFWAGMAFAGGLILGDLTYLAAALFGLSRLAEALGDVFVVRIAAALYLGSIAVRLWRSGARAQPVASRQADCPCTSFLAGLTVTLAIPKTIVFDPAVLPTLLDLRGVTGSDCAVPVAVTALVLIAVMTPCPALALRTRHAVRDSAFHRGLNRSAAAIMAGAAIWTVARRA